MIQVKCPACGINFKVNPWRLKRTPRICCSFQCRFEYRKATFETRFWAKVNKTTETGCWMWTASTKGNPAYGQFRYGNEHLAHRVSWIICKGPIPEGFQVCHNCPGEDRKLCVNPAHLWLGTHKDNAADAVAKGQYARRKPHDPATYRRGSASPKSKLTETEVKTMRQRYKAGCHWKVLKADYGICKAHVFRIIKGKNWTHV